MPGISLFVYIGKELLTDTEESYAEHPYIRGYYKDYYIEIVPCYKIEKSSQKLSAVDRTPLHTDYVKNNPGTDYCKSQLAPHASKLCKTIIFFFIYYLTYIKMKNESYF